MPPPPDAFRGAWVLTGATGSGKSSFALEVAERIGAEIVSMDSMTLYRGLDIGTAKPSAVERARVPHHLIDVLDPWEAGNVAWWLDRAAEACAAIRSRGRRPLFVGGTPFYLKALACGLFEGPPSDPAVRGRLEAEGAEQGALALHARLRAVDPVTAERLHPNDLRRVVRALEVWELTGQTIRSCQKTWDTAAFGGGGGRAVPCVILEWPRGELYHRIERRVEEMLAAGWEVECRRLCELPQKLSKEASQALGYRELFAHIEGRGPVWPETVALIKLRTRQFAKRQLTWFRNLGFGAVVRAGESGVLERSLQVWREQEIRIAAEGS